MNTNLSDWYHLSMRLVQDYLQGNWQLHLCPVTIYQVQVKPTTAVVDSYGRIPKHLRSQTVTHIDETRNFLSMLCHWAWTLEIQGAY